MLWCGLLGICCSAAQELRFEGFSTSRGLVHNQVKCVMQDQKGFLWIGTQNGVSRFDGVRFDNHDLDHLTDTNVVIGLFELKNGQVGAVLPKGLALFQGDHFVFPTFNQWFEGSSIKQSWLIDNELWLGTRDGLWVWRGVNVDPVKIDAMGEADVNCVFKDDANRLWVATRGEGLFMGQDLSWQHFHQDDGLPVRLINDVIQDREGTIWVATHKGLCYWDGDRFQQPPWSVELTSPIIYGLVEDQHSNLWIRTSLAGLFRWNGSSLDAFNARNGLTSNINVQLFEDHQGTLWAGTPKGLSRWDGDGFVVVDEKLGFFQTAVNAIYEDHQNNLWFATHNGLFRNDINRFVTAATWQGNSVPPHLSLINHIYKDKAQRLWIPTFEGLFKVQDGALTEYTTEDGLPHMEVNGLVEDRSGAIWSVTSRGAARITASGCDVLDDANLTQRPIAQVVSDNNGVVWFLRTDLRVFQLKPGMSESQAAFFQTDEIAMMEMQVDPDGYVWFRARDRMIYAGPDGIESFIYKDISPELTVTAVLPAGNGTLWLGTNQGLVACGRHQTNIIELEHSDMQIVKLSRAPHGTLWLALVRKSNRTSEPIGVATYDGVSIDYHTDYDFARFSVTGFVHFPNQQTWLLQPKGVTHFDGKTFTSIGIDQGLAGNKPTKVLMDHRGAYWIASQGGITKYHGGLLTSYDTRDGLLRGEVTDLAFDSQQTLWIRSRGGLQSYQESQIPPAVEIHAVETSDGWVDQKKPLSLAHNRSDLTIHFRGISLAPGSEHMQYRYKLAGSDQGWIGPTSETKVHLNRLAPGPYRFVVQAFSRDLYECEQYASFDFEILPPIWQTPWFLISAVTALGFLGFLRIAVASWNDLSSNAW